jgi:membrane-associated phospholipid phosphatase
VTHELALVRVTSGLSLNDRWYLDVNRFARQTPGLHAFMRFYAHFGGVGLLALLLLVAWWVARFDRRPERAVALVLWAAGGTVLAWILAHYGLKPLVAEKRPYLVLPHVEVLLHRTHGYAFPSGHATVAGAVIAGLWLARRWVLAVLASLAGLLLGFGRVYTGMHYPFDVVGGLLIGAAFVLVLAWPAVALLEAFDRLLVEHTPFGWLVRAGGRARSSGPLGAGSPRRGVAPSVGTGAPRIAGTGHERSGAAGIPSVGSTQARTAQTVHPSHPEWQPVSERTVLSTPGAPRLAGIPGPRPAGPGDPPSSPAAAPEGTEPD